MVQSVLSGLLLRHRGRFVPLCMVLVAASAIWFATSLAGLTPASWGTALVVPAMVLGGLACLAAGQPSHQSRAARRFWRQLGTASFIVGVGYVLRTYHSITDPDPHRMPFHTIDMAVLMVSVVVEGWALLRLPLGLHSRTQRWAFGLDICTVLAAASLFLWQFFYRPLATARHDQALIVALVTEAVSQVVLFALVKVGMTGSRTLNAGSLRLLGGALLFAAVFTAPDSYLASHTRLTASQLVLPVACVLVAYAARREWQSVPAAPDQVDVRSRRSFSVLPYVAVAATDALLLISSGDQERSGRLVVATGVVAITMLVVGRQIMTFRENRRLVSRLDAGMIELRDHERRFRSLVQHSSDIITITSAEGIFTYVSPGIEPALGRTVEEVQGGPAVNLLYPDDLEIAVRHFQEIVTTPGATARYQLRLVHADGSLRWMEVTTSNLLHDPGVAGLVGNVRDITDTRLLQERLTYQANHDTLTKLPNRALFAERMAAALGGPGGAAATGVVLVDLNEFKAVNDNLGHAVGDALLVATADRLRRLAPPGSTPARLGGDEFALLLPGTSAEALDAVVRELAAAFGPPVLVGGRTVPLAASIGSALGSGEANAKDSAEANAKDSAEANADELLRRADVAMYAAKGDGERKRTRHARYTASMNDAFAMQSGLEVELRRALDNGDLHLLYQPIVDIERAHLVAVEALLRWTHPERGVIGPASFIPMAEKVGLVVPLGAWVLRAACAQAARWERRYGESAPTLGVNVSPRQLAEPSFAADVARVLSELALPADRLTVEVTESVALTDAACRVNLEHLRRLGVRIALDDFGTGQSTLDLLDRCPVDALKLDRSFTAVCTDPGRRGVAIAVNEIAKALGLAVVAEGVETPDQARVLADLGYRYMQGYLFDTALPAAEIDRLLDAPEALRSPVITVERVVH